MRIDLKKERFIGDIYYYKRQDKSPSEMNFCPPIIPSALFIYEVFWQHVSPPKYGRWDINFCYFYLSTAISE